MSKRQATTVISGLPKIKRTLPTIPTTLFSFKDKVFSAEASTLQPHIWNSYITLANPETGGTKAFDLVEVNRDAEGDVKFWRFESKDGLRIMIWND